MARSGWAVGLVGPGQAVGTAAKRMDIWLARTMPEPGPSLSETGLAQPATRPSSRLSPVRLAAGQRPVSRV